MNTGKICGLRMVWGIFMALFVASCSSGQDTTLRSGESSTVAPANVVGRTLVVGDGAEVGVGGVARDESILQRFRGTDNFAPGDGADFDTATGMAGDGSPLQREYHRQGSIDDVGAAYVYAWTRRGGLSGLSDAFEPLAAVPGQPSLGFGSTVHMFFNDVTGGSNLFDVTHPEFRSSRPDNNPLTRVRVTLAGGGARFLNIPCSTAGMCEDAEVMQAASGLSLADPLEFRHEGLFYPVGGRGGNNIGFIQDIGGTLDASAERMGLLALVNGLRDGEDSATNVQGIAPEARLHVLNLRSSAAMQYDSVRLADAAANRNGDNVLFFSGSLGGLPTGTLDMMRGYEGVRLTGLTGGRMNDVITRLGERRFALKGLSGADFTVKLGTQYVRGDRSVAGVAVAGGMVTIESRGTYIVPAGTKVTSASSGTTETYTGSTAVFLQVGDMVELDSATAKIVAPQYLLDLLDDDANLDDDVGFLTPSEITDAGLEDLQLTRMLFEGLYGRYADTQYDFITPLLASVATRNRFHKDIYVFAGNNDGNNGHSSFVALPFYIDIEAQRRRARVQGVIDDAVAADDGLEYDDGTLTFTAGNRSFVVSNLASDPIGTIRVTRAAFTTDGAHLQLFFEGGRSVLLPVGTQYASILPYTVIAMADDDANGCGATVQDYCIVAPGSYVYRTKGGDNAYGGGDDVLADSSASNDNDAAAALVSGGIALLQQIFDDQLSSVEIVDRLFRTASRGFTGYDVAKHGQGMLDLECAVRPTFSVEDSRCRLSDVGRLKEDCVEQGFGYDITTRQCLSPEETTAGESLQCDAAGAVFRNGDCVVTQALCVEAGLIFDSQGTRCVGDVSDCPDGQGFADNACATPVIDNTQRAASEDVAAALCHDAGRVFARDLQEGDLVNPRCVARDNGCPSSQGVIDREVTISGTLRQTARCTGETEVRDSLFCLEAGRGWAGDQVRACTTRPSCDLTTESYDADTNTCLAQAPDEVTDCSNQGLIYNQMAGADDECVEDVLGCDVGETLNTEETACVAAAGVCAATAGYNNAQRSCIDTPSLVSDCTAIGRVLESVGQGADACVADSAACQTDEANIGDQCQPKSECLKTMQGYDMTAKECVAGTTVMLCSNVNSDAVLNNDGDACLSNRFECPAGFSVVISGQCQPRGMCLDNNQGYDDTMRGCVNVTQASDVGLCRAAGTSNALYDSGVTGGCAENAAGCSTGRVQGLASTMNECITEATCRSSTTQGAVSTATSTCLEADAVTCAVDGGRAFDINNSGACSASMATSGQCTASTVQFAMNVGCVAACSALQGYRAGTGCVTPATATECSILGLTYNPAGTSVGCVANAAACDANEAAINSECQARGNCVTTLMQGYDSSAKECAVPSSLADCTAASATSIYNVNSGGNECVATATGCDMNEAAISRACVDRNQCVTMSSGMGYDSSTQLCVAGSGASCFALNGGFLLSNRCVLMATNCGTNNVAVRDTTAETAVCTSRNTACTGTTTGFNQTTNACITPMNAADCAGGTLGIFNASSGGNVCVATTAACDTDETAVSTGGGMACTGKMTACTGANGYISASKTCGEPMEADDCDGLTNAIYNERSGTNQCVLAAANCDNNEAVGTVTGGMACQDRATACKGTQGYFAATKTCGEPTSVANCAGLTNMIFNAGTTNACVSAASDCDSGEALNTAGTACVDATMACSTAQGFDNANRVCVDSPTAAQCVAVMRLLSSTAGNGCVTACAADEASSSSMVGSVAAGNMFQKGDYVRL